MKQGNQFFLEFQIEDNNGTVVDVMNVLKVQFIIGDLIKTYDGISDEVLWDNENKNFKVWLTEDETFNFDKQTKMDARILFKGDNDYKPIGGTYIESKYWYDSLKKVELDDGEKPTPSTDLSEYFDTKIETKFQEEYDYEAEKENKVLTAFIDNSKIIKKIPTFSIDDENTESVINLFAGGISYENEINIIIKSKKIKKCNGMFMNSHLTKINFNEDFDTSNVTDMGNMFANNYNLKSINLNNFNTNKVINMKGMFDGCQVLTRLDLSSFDTSNVTNMETMFNGCTFLTNLNISNFNFDKVVNYSDMFGIRIDEINTRVPENCYILVKDVSAKEWITSKFDWLNNVHYVGE